MAVIMSEVDISITAYVTLVVSPAVPVTSQPIAQGSAALLLHPALGNTLMMASMRRIIHPAAGLTLSDDQVIAEIARRVATGYGMRIYIATPDSLRLIEAQDAAMDNASFQPNVPDAGTTHCNQASLAIAKKMGATTDGVMAGKNGLALDANTQIYNLANTDNSCRASVTPEEAQELANDGTLVFATQTRKGHGHIVSVRPEGVPGDRPVGKTGPILANVGEFNGVSHQSKVFTPKHGDIIYFTAR